MQQIKTRSAGGPDQSTPKILVHDGAPAHAPSEPAPAPTLEQTVRELHHAGRSQRAIARDLSIDRRKVRRIIGNAVAS
jgi:DNA invertase Pin-like site-specific DNA recombinase